MTAMHLTGDTGASEVRNEKRKVLEALRPLNRDDVGMHVVRGQYAAGEINSSPTVGYVEEPDIPIHSQNDTFIAARLWIDNPFWKGVPFYIRTGKRLMEKSTQITIEFKSPIQDIEGNQAQVHSLEPNLLVLNVSPTEGLSLQLNIKNPLRGRLEPVIVDFASSQKDVPEAYELLLHDAMCGDATFFAHWDEVELSWRWVQPILNAFKNESVPLHLYPSGTMGPEAADQLLAEDGFNWW
ncbi:Glucose-6-phosphate 1-dehydrogenase [compost metagenome]